MTPAEEAKRLREQFGEYAFKVVDELTNHSNSHAKQLYFESVKAELQKPVDDPYIEDVPELSKLILKIRDMMQIERPDLGYNQIKMSDLPPPETFALMRRVGTRSLTNYKDGYEKYNNTIKND